MSWIMDNIGTIVVAFVLAVIVGAIIWSMIRAKKQGKSSCSCGGNCASCGACSECNSNQKG